MARVTGIGGVFLKARDPKALAAWYAQHLGIQLADYGGATLLWSDEVPAGTGQTAWMLFPDTTKHFGDPAQRAMINYRVDDLEALLTQLRAANTFPPNWSNRQPMERSQPSRFQIVASKPTCGTRQLPMRN